MTPAARDALEELGSYLSDQIPPLFFAGAVQELFAVPPEIVAAQIVGWASRQISSEGQLPTADYLFHAAKKLHLLAELELVAEEQIKEFISGLRPGLMSGCPEADRASLTADLERLDLEVGVGTVGGVDVVYRRAKGEYTAPRRETVQVLTDRDLEGALAKIAAAAFPL